MPRIEANLRQEDIAALGRKLDQLGESLTDNERQALAAIFAIAGQTAVERGNDVLAVAPVQARRRVQVERRVATPSLSTSFENIFQPGLSAAIRDLGQAADVSVEGTVKWSR